MLTRPYMVIITLVVSTLLSGLDRNFGYFSGLTIVILILWSGKFSWSQFGIGRNPVAETVIGGLLITVALFVFIDLGIQPLLEINLGEIDLSSLGDIRNDPINYLIMSIIVWVFAAFGEELLFHGYYMKHLAEFFGGSNKAWLFSAIFIAVYFGASHNYQGPAGMIAVGLAGLFHSLIFYRYRNRLMMLVFAHGFYDMIGLTLIYFNQERMFIEWYQ